MDPKATLLIVDDEPFNLDILQEHLEDEGFEVHRAEDGKIALEILEKGEHEFSSILLDRMMPEMDGLTVLQKVKENDQLKHIPVIFQTAAASQSDIAEGIKAGAYYYMTKPFEPELMIAIVNSAVMDYQNLQSTINAMGQAGDISEYVSNMKLCFRSVKDAQKIAGHVANLFPDPDRVLLGLTEILINAVEHGNLGITYDEKSALLTDNTWAEEIEARLADEKYAGKIATVEFSKNDDNYMLIIKDQGSGFDWEKFVDMGAERVYDSHGRGIAMAGMISFDKIQYVGTGSEVHCYVNI